MSISGVIVAWGLFYYRLFDLAPVARATVIDGMDDGVIVLDAQQRLVDVNAAARQLVGEPLPQRHWPARRRGLPALAGPDRIVSGGHADADRDHA